jgi:hypothetical protein
MVTGNMQKHLASFLQCLQKKKNPFRPSWFPPIILIKVPGLFRGIKRPGRVTDLPSLSSAEVASCLGQSGFYLIERVTVCSNFSERSSSTFYPIILLCAWRCYFWLALWPKSFLQPFAFRFSLKFSCLQITQYWKQTKSLPSIQLATVSLEGG